MRRVGKYIGADQPVPVGARRYLDVALDDDGTFQNGLTYGSKENKMVGPLVERTPAHLTDEARQNASLDCTTNESSSPPPSLIIHSTITAFSSGQE